MFDIEYVANPKELFYTPDPNNFPVRKYHTSRPIQYKAAHIKTPHISIDIQSIMTSNWMDEEPHETDLPFLPQEILKMIHNFGYSMLLDDKKDIGKFATPTHPSSIHHWYVGAAMMTIAQIGGMIQKMKEFAEVGASMGGLSELTNLSGTEERPSLVQNPKMLENIPFYGNPSDMPPAIPYNQLYRGHHNVLPYQSLNQGRIRRLPNNNIKSLPQLSQPTKSIVPNPLRGLVNR